MYDSFKKGIGMKKYIVVLSACLFMSLYTESDYKPVLLELKPSYFFYSDATMREIYHNGGFQIQGSTSYACGNHFAVYGGIGYIHTSGLSLNAEQKTSIWQIPLDFGVQTIFNVGDDVDWYTTFGPRYFYVHQHNDSTYVNTIFDQSGIGFFLNTGFNFFIAEHCDLTLFAEYSYEKTSFVSTIPNVYSQKHVQLGGIAFGVGLGYAF